MKALWWDNGGSAIDYKRLDEGLFQFPRSNQVSVDLSRQGDASNLCCGIWNSHMSTLRTCVIVRVTVFRFGGVFAIFPRTFYRVGSYREVVTIDGA